MPPGPSPAPTKTSALRPVRGLLIAIAILMGGAGVMGTLIGLKMEAAGAPAPLIGLAATAYFVGLTIGSQRVLPVVQRVGHIRAFAAFVALLSASTLAYSLDQRAALWIALRFIDGVCIAGVYVCVESWLMERSEPASRGSALAAYMIALYSGQAAAQFLVNLGGTTAFAVASMLISLAIIPVVLTRSKSPTETPGTPLPMRTLYAISPLGLVGAGITGIILGAFYGLGAIYAQRLGMSVAATANFMGAVIFGGVALQWPLGWLSDRFDRRKIILATFAGAAALSAALALTGATGLALVLLGAVFGGLSFALYPLCVAHANDHLSPDLRVAASGGLVLVYSAGAAIGPLAAGGALRLLGPPGFFISIAIFAGAAMAFGLWRLTVRPSVPPDQQQSYQALPRTTPMSASLAPIDPQPDQGP